jgi:hypothetical protein
MEIPWSTVLSVVIPIGLMQVAFQVRTEKALARLDEHQQGQDGRLKRIDSKIESHDAAINELKVKIASG